MLSAIPQHWQGWKEGLAIGSVRCLAGAKADVLQYVQARLAAKDCSRRRSVSTKLKEI